MNKKQLNKKIKKETTFSDNTFLYRDITSNLLTYKNNYNALLLVIKRIYFKNLLSYYFSTLNKNDFNNLN